MIFASRGLRYSQIVFFFQLFCTFLHFFAFLYTMPPRPSNTVVVVVVVVVAVEAAVLTAKMQKSTKKCKKAGKKKLAPRSAVPYWRKPQKKRKKLEKKN